MNTRILLNLCCVLFLLASCSKDAAVVNELDAEISSHAKAAPITHDILCIFDGADVEIHPFCNADPIDFPETAFPISVILNEERIFHQGYSYEWSTGSTGSAISISYNELPVTLTLTEDATGCQVVLTLDQDYWGKASDISAVSVCHLPTSTALPVGADKVGNEKVTSGGF